MCVDSMNRFRLLDAETPPIQPKAFGWTVYNNYSEIYNWLDELLETYPDVLTNYVIGSTYQGRPIRAVKISHKPVRVTFKVSDRI